MVVHLTTLQLDSMLRRAAKVGAEAALVATGAKPEFISQRKAYSTYGEAKVDRWVAQCWVTPKPTGESSNSRIEYSVVELEIANSKSIYENSTDHVKK